MLAESKTISKRHKQAVKKISLMQGMVGCSKEGIRTVKVLELQIGHTLHTADTVK